MLTTAERAIKNVSDYTRGSCFLENTWEVFEGERHVINESLSYLSEKELKEDPVIYAENQSVVQTIHNNNPENHEFARTTLTLLTK